jgi:hypothetical protein
MLQGEITVFSKGKNGPNSSLYGLTGIPPVNPATAAPFMRKPGGIAGVIPSKPI